MAFLNHISIEGFKSIRHAELTLDNLNIIIGANGAGKSNLIGVFRLLQKILDGKLQTYVANEPDGFLFHGRKKTSKIRLAFTFENMEYEFILRPERNSLVLEEENIKENKISSHISHGISLSGYPETGLPDAWPERLTQKALFLKDCFTSYHFHDTSDASPAKQTTDIDDNRFLRADAGNLAAYLYWLQEKAQQEFRRIEEHIRLVAPFFDHFVLAPLRLNERKIKLEWRHKDSDAYFDAYSLSDGTLRFICLATLLLQPKPPALMLLDEPELGLHPAAIALLAEMLATASQHTQILLATQSVTLLNHFQAENIIVADHNGQETTFRRLQTDDLQDWLQDYALGELWEKNILGGRP